LVRQKNKPDWHDLPPGTLSSGYWRHTVTLNSGSGFYRVRRLPWYARGGRALHGTWHEGI